MKLGNQIRLTKKHTKIKVFLKKMQLFLQIKLILREKEVAKEQYKKSLC